MRALGAKVILCRGVPFTNTEEHYYHVAKRLAAENEDHVFVNQFENLWNGAAHYFGTAPEIFDQTGSFVWTSLALCGAQSAVSNLSFVFALSVVDTPQMERLMALCVQLALVRQRNHFSTSCLPLGNVSSF